MSVETRPPIITILGHVDHGKTTLLDYIRKTVVAASEHGGITQAIGAYQVESEGKIITFIDTPGHAAFEKMRSRGAGVADISVLVVAANDGVMPQTVEAIKHIKKAATPMIVAINKIDLPEINLKVQLEKIKKQLSDQGVLIEEYGGDVPFVPISAKSGEGIKDLLTTINLMAEVHEFTGDASVGAVGVVLEAHLDKSKGPVATVLILNGSLKRGDALLAGDVKGKVRGLFSWAGKIIDIAGPSTPVEVLGFESVPNVGTRLGEIVPVPVDTLAKTLSGGLIAKLRASEENLLNVVIRADKQGSLEAIVDIVENANKEKKHIKIISSGTGDINDSDVELAQATKAIVLGFNIEVKSTAKRIADTGHVLVRTYTVIYELAEEVEEVVQGMLIPGQVEEVFGRAQIIAEFPFGKNEHIAGCKVLEGTISKGPRIRLVRGEEVVAEGKIKSLKKAREEVTKVEKGQECGMMFDPVLVFAPGDLVESFRKL